MLTFDCHCQSKEYLREEEEGINHQFDVWHFYKSIKVKLWMLLRRKHEELKPWIKLTCNHFWWSCTTCEGEEILLKEKWTSIFFHIQRKHWWTGNSLYCQCSHSELSFVDECSKNWLHQNHKLLKHCNQLSLINQFWRIRRILHNSDTLVYWKCTIFYLINGLQKAHTSLAKAWLPNPS